MNICKLLKDGAILIDVRSENEFREGRLPNAINIPLHSINTTTTKCNVDDTVVLYCVSGARSNSASRQLRGMGFSKVYDLGSFRNYDC